MSEHAQSALSVRLMSESDIDGALDLCRHSGWNQMRSDWLRLLRYEPNGCFAAICGGQVVGTVTTTQYGQLLAWIGMMLVHPTYRRRGIATALLQHSMAYLDRYQVQCIKLDATPTGNLVYKQLGFRPEWDFQRWSRAGSSSAKQVETSSAPERLSAVHIELDRHAFGANRSRFLGLLSAASQVLAPRYGFGMLRPGFLASYLGPVSAASKSSAESIIGELCDRTSRTIFWDIPAPNSHAVQIAKSLGFEPVRDLTRMWTGSRCCQPDLRLQFALAGPATG